MERIAREFATLEDSDAADRAYYRPLTPEERIQIMIDLIYPEGGDERVERVGKIVKFGESAAQHSSPPSRSGFRLTTCGFSPQ